MLELEWNAASAVPALDYSFRGPVHLPGNIPPARTEQNSVAAA